MPATYRDQITPTQTLPVGTTVITSDVLAITGGWNPNTRRRGASGTIVGYATPEIQTRQVWRDESYYVRLDGETGQRVINRHSLIAI